MGVASLALAIVVIWVPRLAPGLVAAALIDRLIHHATIVTLKGKSYRLRERGTGIVLAQAAPCSPEPRSRRAARDHTRAPEPGEAGLIRADIENS